ncbi:MAG: lamin tail domain-containing protein [Candidatus Wildermuthbacteria bacterium]|nr:lamin tail domain-containing protein [Candidatus Wildermuthbacteria bacterium]
MKILSNILYAGIVINEVAWMGSPVENVGQNNWWRLEWIELYNNGDIVELLNGWALELYRDKLDFKISLQGNIPPKGYYLIGASDKIKNIDLNYANLAGKFVNSGQRVVLKNSAGQIVDEIDARSSWPAGDNETKRTLERVPSGFQTSAEIGGTPRAPNSAGIQLQQIRNSNIEIRNKSQILNSKFELLNSPVIPACALAGVSAAVLLLVRRRMRR